jgi:uncharacterized 2Fe-2S/4Fe-4S cluster protein (DUF4445 family)
MSNDDAWIKRVPLKLRQPSLKDNTADVDRLLRGLRLVLRTDRVGADYNQGREIPSSLRRWGYSVDTVLYRDTDSWRLIGLFPSGGGARIHGLAVDLGSSTIAMNLLDLATGEIKGERSFLNPQNSIGPDILTRIHYTSREGGLETLQSLLILRLNDEIGRLCREQGIRPDSIMGMAVAGNTTMGHLFLGLDPYWICREPYIPAVNSPGLLTAAELKLEIHPRAPVLVLPNVGSYFGGDLIAGILASGMTLHEEISLMVDVGTNAEVALGNKDWIVACAGAAGPALEGGVTKIGMMAGPGAIDRVVLDRHTGGFLIRTIDDGPPVGICGSGLIDLVAQLYLSGMVDLRGKLVPARCGERLREIDGQMHLIIVDGDGSGTGRDLTLTQAEIDSTIRSKAAMYSVLTTIIEMVHLSWRDIGRFYIAGTFGSYIEPRSAITIGMIPDLPADAYLALGNTSLAGATRAILSTEARQECSRIRDRITYVELNVNQAFMNLLSASKFIPHTDRSMFPSVRTWQEDA